MPPKAPPPPAEEEAPEEAPKGKFFFENGATYEGEYTVLPPDPDAEVPEGAAARANGAGRGARAPRRAATRRARC